MVNDHNHEAVGSVQYVKSLVMLSCALEQDYLY